MSRSMCSTSVVFLRRSCRESMAQRCVMLFDHSQHRRNPFATRYVASARLAPRDSRGRVLDLPAIVDRLGAIGGSGAIEGPHGTGKSNLLFHLSEVVASESRPVVRIRMRSRGDVLGVLLAMRQTPRGGLACVDSWELLGTVGRSMVRCMARGLGIGLMVTSHGPTDLPTLVSCRASRALLESLVGQLPGHGEWFGTTIMPADLDAAIVEAGEDLRRAFDLLYDRFERSRAGAPR